MHLALQNAETINRLVEQGEFLGGWPAFSAFAPWTATKKAAPSLRSLQEPALSLSKGWAPRICPLGGFADTGCGPEVKEKRDRLRLRSAVPTRRKA